MASIYQLLNRQIPTHIREQYPVFCKFIEYYYRWLQTRGFDRLEKVTDIDYTTRAIGVKNCVSKEGLSITNADFVEKFVGYTITNEQGVVAEIIGYDENKLFIRYLTVDAEFNINDKIYVRQDSSKSIDEKVEYDTAYVDQLYTLPSAFIEHFSNYLDANNIFETNNANIALILKNIWQLYQAKGSEQALKYFLKSTRGVDSDIRYPWKNVLRPSDGKWKRQYAVTIWVDDAFIRDEIFTNFNTVHFEIPSVDPNNKESTFVEQEIIKIEIFGSQSENYDNDDYWFARNGDEGNSSYGSHGDGRITPFVRLYFDHNPESFVGQYVKVISRNEENKEYVSLDGKVVESTVGLDIVKGGKSWQLGQVFTVYGQDSVALFDESEMDKTENGITTNVYGVQVQHSSNTPLIGRVTGVDKGAITAVEIIQLGDHIPLGANKVIEICPLYADKHDFSTHAHLNIKYGVNSSMTGAFEDTSGMLSENEIRIQDSYYYQQFSYDIVSTADPKTYVDMAEMMHPAGTKMFMTYMLEADIESNFELDMDSNKITISLFDIAVLADKLTKYVVKKLTDELVIQEALTLIPKKNLKDESVLKDDYNQNTVLYSYDASYDSGDPSMMYFAREYNSDGRKSGYVDSGNKMTLHINYDYLKQPNIGLENVK